MGAVERKIVVFLVTGGGAGYFPKFPGTVGTLVAVPISLGVNRIAGTSLPVAVLTLAAAIFCAITLATKGAEIFAQKDPAKIVIDEIVGFMVASFLCPVRIVPLTAAFLLFRFFDIAKIFPISRLERLPGGSGIVLDDVMAGIYTFVILQLLLLWGLL
jgi:phosphatidylglycerophosphatase A